MLKLSIIVPAYGSQQEIDNTLLTVLENRPAACEVVVPHPDTYEDPYDLSDEVRFVQVAQTGITALLNGAIASCQSEIIHLLGSGTLATRDWTDPILSRFDEDESIAAISPLLLDSQRPTRTAAAGIRYAGSGSKCWVGRGSRIGKRPRRYQVDGPAWHAAFFRRKTLLKVGPFREDFGVFHLDSDYAARLRAAQLTCVHEADSRLMTTLPTAPRGWQAGRQAELLYRTHRATFGSARSRLAHSLLVGWESLRQFPTPSAFTTLLGRAHGVVTRCPAEIPAPAHHDACEDASLATPTLRFEMARDNRSQASQDGRRVYGKTG